MPEIDPSTDGHVAGDLADTRLADVQRFLAPFGERILFHKGFSAETATGLEKTQFALVYVDVDIYKYSRSFYYPRMVPGGAMLFDDFDAPRFRGVR